MHALVLKKIHCDAGPAYENAIPAGNGAHKSRLELGFNEGLKQGTVGATRYSRSKRKSGFTIIRSLTNLG